MGDELSTAGGVIGTAATGLAAVVTFKQVDALNKANENVANFTKEQAQGSVIVKAT